MTLCYIDYLEERLRDQPPEKKGLRTRERIKLTAAKLLEAKGFHAMRVIDIAEQAGVAEGSFYIYFKDKTEVAVTVLTELLEEFFPIHLTRSRDLSPFESIQFTNRRWIALSRANPGLVRCILLLSDHAPEFAELSRQIDVAWYRRIAANIVRRRKGLNENAVTLMVQLLGGMMDEVVRNLVIYPDPDFIALAQSLGADDDAVADAASVIWLRILHPNAPRPALSSEAKALASVVFARP